MFPFFCTKYFSQRNRQRNIDENLQTIEFYSLTTHHADLINQFILIM